MQVCVVPFCVMEKKVGTVYKLRGRLYSPEKFPPHSGVTLESCQTAVKFDLVDALELALRKHLETISRISSIQSVSGGGGEGEGYAEGEAGEDDEDPSAPSARAGGDGEGNDDDDDDGSAEDQGADAQKRRKQENDEVDYEDDAGEERGLARKAAGLEQTGDEPSGFESEIDQAELDEDYSLGGEAPAAEAADEDEEEPAEAEEGTRKSNAMESPMGGKSETGVTEGKQSAAGKTGKRGGPRRSKKPSDKAFFVEVSDLSFEVHFLFRDEPHILLAEIAQKAAKNVYVKESGNIEQCSVIEDKVTKRVALETAGVNFRSFWQLDEHLDVNHIRSNDIHAVLRTYGVEAARAAIINEVKNVFDYYKISVDIRHLSLIADFMTVDGGYRPMNRIGAACFGTSPFSKMTFETATKFIVEAALHGEVDTLESPSASVCLGQPVRMGTGCFDLMHNLQL